MKDLLENLKKTMTQNLEAKKNNFVSFLAPGTLFENPISYFRSGMMSFAFQNEKTLFEDSIFGAVDSKWIKELVKVIPNMKSCYEKDNHYSVYCNNETVLIKDFVKNEITILAIEPGLQHQVSADGNLANI